MLFDAMRFVFVPGEASRTQLQWEPLKMFYYLPQQFACWNHDISWHVWSLTDSTCSKWWFPDTKIHISEITNWVTKLVTNCRPFFLALTVADGTRLRVSTVSSREFPAMAMQSVPFVVVPQPSLAPRSQAETLGCGWGWENGIKWGGINAKNDDQTRN